jgi:hypothetical protein
MTKSQFILALGAGRAILGYNDQILRRWGPGSTAQKEMRDPLSNFKIPDEIMKKIRSQLIDTMRHINTYSSDTVSICGHIEEAWEIYKNAVENRDFSNSLKLTIQS